MTRFQRSCSNCNEPFDVDLSEATTRVDFSKCEDIDTNYHNLEYLIQCQNCEDRLTLYYCVDGHPLIAMGD